MKKLLHLIAISIALFFISNNVQAQAPSVEASNTQLSYKFAGAGMSITWTRGNGQACMVVMRKNTSSGTVPNNNSTNYSASAGYGSGSLVNGVTDNYVVYKGTGNSVYVYSLAYNTNYDVYVYEYNLSLGVYYYNTNYGQSALNFNTVAAQPGTCGSITGVSPANSSAIISSSNGNGNGHLITVSPAGTSASAAIQGYYYATSATYGSGAYVGGAYAVYQGTGTSVNVTGLAGATTYRAYDYEYENGSSSTSTSYDLNTRNYLSCNTFTFNTTNIPPTINAVTSFTSCEGAFTLASLTGITDGSTAESQNITITATSSNTSLIPNPTVSYASPNTSGYLFMYPAAGQYGSAIITVKLNDGWSVNNTTTITFVVTIMPNPGAAGAISGASPICSGTSHTYSITPTTSTTSYSWTLPSGFTATSGSTTNVITVSTTSATATGTLSVYGINNNGCGNGASSNLIVQVDQQPGAANAGADQPLVCIANAFLNAAAVSGSDAGQWSWLTGTPVPSIGTATVNSTSISGLTSPNTYQYVWTVTRPGSVCPAKKDTVSITTNWASVSCQPAAAFSYGPSSDVSSTSVCLGSTTNFNDLSISANQWQWDFNYNGSTPNYTSSSQNPSYTYSATGTYTVYLHMYSNATSQYYNTSHVVNVIGAPAAPVTIFGTTNGICAGSTSQYVYSISNVINATSYNWNVPTGANISAYPSSTSIATIFGNNAVSGNVTVSAANSCGTSTVATLSVSINPLPAAAGTINGSATVCEGQSGVTYSISPIANATNYIWTDINGNTVTGTSTSATYSFSTSATNGSILVQGSNTCGVGITSNLSLTLNPLPGSASNILGSASINICPGPDSVTYIVSTISNATSYNWAFPTGTTIVGGNNKDTMQIVFSNAGSGSQQINVNGVNACGNGASANLSVFVNAPTTPQICLVTVDSLSTHNIVYWDKTTVTGADSFKIYREISTGIYNQIGTVSYHALSEYHDYAVNPNTTTYRYKISAIDSCGNESAQSNFHNTVYVATLGGGQFNWNLYTIENTPNPVTNYVLMRDTNNTGIFVQVATASGNATSLNDVNYASYPNGQWYVDALGFNCTPSLRLNGNSGNSGNNSTMAAKVKSHSNQTNNRGVGIKKITANSANVNLYPNPAQNNLQFTVSNEQIKEITLFDVIGKQIINDEVKITNNIAQLDLTNLNNGVYFINILTENGVYTKKFIVQK